MQATHPLERKARPMSTNLETFYFGPLAVKIDHTCGRVVAILDKITGKNASPEFYSPRYIETAGTQARLAWELTQRG